MKAKKYIKGSIEDAYLSVFWYIDGVFLGPEATINDDDVVSLYGNYLQLDLDHFSIWNKIAKGEGLDPNVIEYDFYPRGRIMYDTMLHKFKVVGDPKIVNNNKLQDELITFYNLPNKKSVIFQDDEHYTSIADV